MKYTNYFEAPIKKLLESTTEEDEIFAAKALIKSYTYLFEKLVAPANYGNTMSITLDGGIALSSQHAIDCLHDVIRTTRFIKGVYLGILDAQKKFPNTQLEIVYAGSGPAATLIIPLLHLFKENELSITILDVNETSINSVNAIVDYLGFSNFFGNILLQDAITYTHPKGNPLHMVISETMDKGLTVEPQVRITQNLAAQLHPEGILIPEEIRVTHAYSFFSKQYYFDIYQDNIPKDRTVKTVGDRHLFSIDKNISEIPHFTFESDFIRKPETFVEAPDLVVYAEVFIYKENVLLKSDSLLSNLYCLNSLCNIEAENFKLRYVASGIPGWELI